MTVAGIGVPGDVGDGGPAVAAQLDEPASVAALPEGGFLIADRANGVIRRVGPDGVISTVAGDDSHQDDGDDRGSLDHDHGDDSWIEYPQDVAPTVDGGFLVADSHTDRIVKVDAEGDLHKVAGDGNEGFGGDGGPARRALLDGPAGVAATPDGGVLIADRDNHRIRRVDAAGTISTVAGNGEPGFSGDLAPATEAQLNAPVAVAVAPGGGFLIADSDNHRLRYVAPDGTIQTFAGTGEAGFNGDGLAPSATQLNEPRGVVALASGPVLVADSANHRVRLFAEPVEPPATPIEQARPADALPPPAPPVAGKRLNVATTSGEIFVKTPGADRYVQLYGAASIPVGSLVDAKDGSVRLTSAANLKGRRQTAVFSRGAFGVRQKRRRRPVTDLVLRGGNFSSCKRSAPGKRRISARRSVAVNMARQRARRGLWGRGHGRFRTRGRHGAATVRGTIWFTQDRCDGTLVRVKRGVVAVDDFARKRRVLVPAGRKYLARSRRAR